MSADITPHVHCAECKRPIATQEIAEDGTATNIAIRGGKQYAVRSPENGGLAIVEVTVPLCEDCFAKIKTAEQMSRIAVPKGLRLN